MISTNTFSRSASSALVVSYGKYTVYRPSSFAFLIAAILSWITLSISHLNCISSFGLPIGTSIITPSTPHSFVIIRSSSFALTKLKILEFKPALFISVMASLSSADTAGIPASIRSTPTSASLLAISTFSCFLITTPGVCSPSLKVASCI